METRRFFILLTTIYAVMLAACSELDRDNPNDPENSDYKPDTTEQTVQLSRPELVDGMLFDDRDGRSYKVVKINGYYWMAENLKYDKVESYCYDDDSLNCEKYGRLYKWTTALGLDAKYETERIPHEIHLHSQDYDICPENWRLPSVYDWRNLLDHTTARGAMSKFGWRRDYNGNDNYGFTALPGGSRRFDGTYENEGEQAQFWTTGEEAANKGKCILLRANYSSYAVEEFYKDRAMSVRCIWGNE